MGGRGCGGLCGRHGDAVSRPAAVIDHLVVAAATLAQGVAWCEATFGLSPEAGGQHALMGTHNRLLNISSASYPAVYLEIIAINPEAEASTRPTRPRWFALDDPALQARLRQSPRLIHVVARTEALALQHQRLRAAGYDLGECIAASRDTPQGRLAWQITVPVDGRLACGGALPTLIQWQGSHPTEHLPARGVSLKRLQLQGVPATAQAALGLAAVVWGAASALAPSLQSLRSLQASFGTPMGEVVLRSDD